MYSIDNWDSGKIQYGIGKVVFEVDFRCIVCRPEVGEVLDAVVYEVLQNAIIADAGPIKIVINQKNFGEREDYKLICNHDVRMFVSQKSHTKIIPGTELRTKILGCRRTTVDTQITFMCVGTIDGDFLGVFTT